MKRFSRDNTARPEPDVFIASRRPEGFQPDSALEDEQPGSLSIDATIQALHGKRSSQKLTQSESGSGKTRGVSIRAIHFFGAAKASRDSDLPFTDFAGKALDSSEGDATTRRSKLRGHAEEHIRRYVCPAR